MPITDGESAHSELSEPEIAFYPAVRRFRQLFAFAMGVGLATDLNFPAMAASCGAVGCNIQVLDGGGTAVDSVKRESIRQGRYPMRSLR
jgi:hypothetical protein